MRFEVPRDIEIEDKIFGPLTWKQFFYVGGGVGFAAVLFLTANRFVFALVGIPIGGLGLLLAFYKVNNRPFALYLESMLNFVGRDRLYLWKKSGTGIYRDQVDEKPTGPLPTMPNNVNTNLHSLSRQLELKAIQQEH